MNKKLVSFFDLFVFLMLLLLCVYVSLSKSLASATIDGVKLWFFCVFPSLFPYVIITTIMGTLEAPIKIAKRFSPITKKAFRVNGNLAFMIIISILSGYPMGAKITADLKNNGFLSQEESIRASCLCTFSSPMFLIASVGGMMFNSTEFGLKLLLIHYFSVILTGFIFSFYKKSTGVSADKSQLEVKKNQNLLYDTAYSSVISVLVVGAIITIFYLLTEILYSLSILTPLTDLLNVAFDDVNLSNGLVFGIFECTKGLKTIAMGNPSVFTLPLCVFLCSFGGISVICQSLTYLKSAKIKTAPFFLAKITSAVLGFIIALLVELFIF